MNIKTKTILILALTLILGFLLGVLTTGLIQRNIITRFMNLRTERGFASHFINLVGPTNDQIDKINPIIDYYAKQSEEINELFREQIRSMMDSMHYQIDPYLTEEQRNLIEERMRNRKMFMHILPPRGKPPWLRKGIKDGSGKPKD